MEKVFTIIKRVIITILMLYALNLMISSLNIIGEINLFCIGYYIYLLIFTEISDKLNYLINGSIIVLLVFLFGLSIVTKKNLSKFFSVLNFIFIILFLGINIYNII